ncbi:complement receptor type 2-like [Argopecten irradians]|uniref:complement receptor type 2-like n=1 Tax=Argopecten irradians TaxID=31199 RepID=UPI00371EC5CB
MNVSVHNSTYSCENLPNIPGANTVSSDYPTYVGATVTFSCQEGFSPTGDPTISCLSNGQWTTPSLVCTSETTTECSTLPIVPGTNVISADYPTHVGASITFSCQEGFSPAGDPTISCLSNGEWTTPSLVCTSEATTVCGPLPNIPGTNSMFADYPTHEGATVTFSCQEGFFPAGDPTISCVSNGQWTTPSLVCTSEATTECGPLPNIPGTNAMSADYPTHEGATVTFSCQEGFSPTGDPTISCLSNGQWTTPSLVCTSETTTECSTLPNVPGTNVISADYPTHVGASITFSCQEGFSPTGDPTISCLSNGEWTTPSLVCTSEATTVCGPLPNIPGTNSMSADYPTHEGATVTFSCQEGFFPAGDPTISCVSNGQWTTPSLVCTSEATTECGPLPNIPGTNAMSADYPTHEGATVTFSCQEGFSPTGDPTISCFSNGQWSTPSLVCTSEATSECGPLPNIPGTNALSADYPTHEGATVTFSCREGFSPTGDPTISCLSNGEWTTPSLVCTSEVTTECGPLPNIPGTNSMSADYPTHEGATVTFSCQEGFFPAGDPTISCVSNGQWTTPSLVCTSEATTECGPLPNIPGTNALSADYPTREGATVTFSCQEGFSPTGDPTISCFSNGQWSTPSLVCTSETTSECGPLPNIPGTNALSADYPTHEGATVTFSCREGFSPTGDPTISCLSNGKWTTPSLVCTSEATTECGPLPNIPGTNALSADYPTHEGATVTFSCQEGFVSVGDPVTICLSDGQWSIPGLSCVNCGADFEYEETVSVCYKLVKDNHLSQTEAMAYCASLGGKLAQLDTSQKITKLSIVLAAEGVPDCFVAGGDTEDEGVWVYPDGSSVNMDLFMPGAPYTNTEENCLMLDTNEHGVFDSDCRFEEIFLCEKLL